VDIDKTAVKVHNFYRNSVDMMKIMARACGHDHLAKFCSEDIETSHRDIAHLAGVQYSCIGGRS